MSGKPFKASFFVFLISLAILTAGKSFAQSTSSTGGDERSSQDQAGEENPQMTLDQIRDEELRLQDELNRLDAIDRALNQSEEILAQAPPKQEVSAQAAPAQQAPAQAVSSQVVPLQAVGEQAAPVPTACTPSPSSCGTFKIQGEARAAVGIYANGHAVFTRANGDLNEKNWRILSDAGLNRDINTYDPALFSRLKLVMDGSVASAVVSLHLNLVVDPWSFTGKSKTQLVNGTGGDSANVQYLFWANTGYTVNTTVYTLKNGDSFSLPEVKTHGNMVPATSITSTFSNIFNIPATKINYTFFPFREAWVDVKPTDELKLRVFPMAYQDQALTTDDPLRLSNNMEWWESSPWINSWQQGNLNTGATPVDFTKGKWDRSLSFLVKDSDGQRLTALRGVSLKWKPGDETFLDATVATPKTLWQDYGDITTLPASVRLKQFIGDLFYIGAVGNMHQGYTEKEELDAANYAEGLDAGLMLWKYWKLSAEYAASQSRYDMTSPGYATQYRGNAYYVSLSTASNPQEEDILKKDYFHMTPVVPKEDFYKSMIYFSRMDQGFESSLSNYHATRDDSYWADHLTFYPSDYRYLPGTAPGLSEYDMEPFAIGNGIDYGRTVIGWRVDADMFEGKVKGLADVRHVTDNDGHNIETASRAGATYNVTDKLTTKALLLWDALPKTTAGVDPFVTDGDTGQYLANTTVAGGKDPSLKTGSLGARYALTDWAALNGVWEYTNDVTLATDNFPQGDLNSSSFSTYTQYGKTYRKVYPYLYDQGYFQQAPYDYLNIFKTGLELIPCDPWHVYFDYTRNPNGFAGNIDDNIDHFGLETSYVPGAHVGFFARYAYSRGYDINRLVNNNNLRYRGYHNFFFEARMVLPKDLTMSLQYGVGPSYNVSTSTFNPSLAYYSTSVYQTQHVVRIVFDKKF